VSSCDKKKLSHHFFRAFSASSFASPLKGRTEGFPLSSDFSSLSADFSRRLPFSRLRSFSFSMDLPVSYSFLASFILIFFWYLRICWAANSKMLASGRPFLQMALRKYS
jgi:hypothetical protein